MSRLFNVACIAISAIACSSSTSSAPGSNSDSDAGDSCAKDMSDRMLRFNRRFASEADVPALGPLWSQQEPHAIRAPIRASCAAKASAIRRTGLRARH